MRMDSRYFLCIAFFFALIQSAVASGDLRKKHLNTSVVHHSSTPDNTGAVKEDKPVGLFSRRRSAPTQRQHTSKPQPETGSGNPGSARHCARQMESCSAHTPCCNPCALCHCRLFNTICKCWRIGVCSRKN